MANFNEHALEMSIMELFKDEGYIHLNGSQIHRERTEILLREDLKQYLYNRYARASCAVGRCHKVCCIVMGTGYAATVLCGSYPLG